MKRLLALLWLMPIVALAADINITNIPTAGGSSSVDKVLGITNTTHTALIPVSQIIGLAANSATNGYPWTNLPASSVAASNVTSGGVLIPGTVSATPLTAGYALGTDGSTRIWTNSLNGVSIGGNAATANLATSAVNSTNFWGRLDVTNLPYTPLGASSNAVSATYVTTSPLTNHINIANVDTPGNVLTNGNVSPVSLLGGLTNSGLFQVGNTTTGLSIDTNGILSISQSNNASSLNFINLTNSKSDGKVLIRVMNNAGKNSTYGIFGSAFGTAGLANQTVLGTGTGSITIMPDGDSGSGGTSTVTFRMGGYNQSNEKVRILGNGNFGLGTTNPSVPLEVSGNAIVSGTFTATNGVQLMVKPSFTTNFTCTTNLQFYLCNGTNQFVTLPNAAYVPNVIYRFSSTNGNALVVITNATGAQTVRDGTSLAITNIGIGEIGLLSDGAAWWIASKSKVVLPNASWSTSTNIALSADTPKLITYDTSEFNNSQGIRLSGTGSLYITNSGQYFITYSAVVNGGGNNTALSIWARQSGVDMPRTRTRQVFTSATAQQCLTVNYIFNVATNNTYFELWAASHDASASLVAEAANPTGYTAPAAPSIIVTINRISDTYP